MEERPLLPADMTISRDVLNMEINKVIPADKTFRDIAEAFLYGVHAWERMEAYYRCAIMEIETKFRVLNEQFSLEYDRNPIESIRTRIKSPESIAEKMMRKRLKPTFCEIESNICDVAGIRVICSFQKDIYLLTDCLLQQDDVTLIRRKDYIENPKPNGYRGMHLIVEVPIFLHNEKRPMKVEVQLRTIAMDFWASLEHKLRYKKELSPELLAELDGELLYCAEASAALDLRMQRIRDKIEEASRPTEDRAQENRSEAASPEVGVQENRSEAAPSEVRAQKSNSEADPAGSRGFTRAATAPARGR